MISRVNENRWADELRRLSRLRTLRTSVTLGFVLLGPVLAIITFVTMEPLGEGSREDVWTILLAVDLVYILVMASLILTSVARTIAARKAKSAGSRLHLRLTGIFAMMALLPTVSVAVFSGFTLNQGLEDWFSERVRQVVGTSLTAAQTYKQEQSDDLAEDAQAIANFIDSRRNLIFINDAEIREILTQGQQLIQRGLKEAYLIDGTGAIRARGERSYLFDFEQPTPDQIHQADTDGLLIIEDFDNDELRALVRLSLFTDRLLYVSRDVDGRILGLLDDTQKTARYYQTLESKRGQVILQFVVLYVGFSVTLLLAAIWLGVWFAERMSRPVGRLTGAAQRVGNGDLDVQVIQEKGDDEIAVLGRYFNQMTRQLKKQRERLLENNRQIESRRRLFDSVLRSVTSGVVGLDSNGCVTFVNSSAQRLLNWTGDEQYLALNIAVPEFADLFERLKESDLEVAQDDIRVIRHGKVENLLVRMGTRRNEDGRLEGYVLAFDDVTDLVTAQRLAAWRDVARRIAHEIKNPLTPIQLSAERIKQKFSPQVGSESEQLKHMTDVIVRQTNDLGRIVDEFSKFARMPKPQLQTEDLVTILRDVLTLQQITQLDVKLTINVPEKPVMADIDATMIGQALTNLVKNAGEAINSFQARNDQVGFVPEIQVVLKVVYSRARITIADNGVGLPADRARLFEPYVTTRDQGTGLGLSIVKKIIEEHAGSLTLEDAPIFDKNARAGAMAIIELPIFIEEARAKPVNAM